MNVAANVLAWVALAGCAGCCIRLWWRALSGREPNGGADEWLGTVGAQGFRPHPSTCVITSSRPESAELPPWSHTEILRTLDEIRSL